MSFLLGLSVGSILGFLVASFCCVAGRRVPSETASVETIEEVA